MIFKAMLVAFIFSVLACTPQPVDNRTGTEDVSTNANTIADSSTLNPDAVNEGLGCESTVNSFVSLVQSNCKSCHEAGAGLQSATDKFAVSSTDPDAARQAIEAEVAQFGGGAGFFDWLSDSRHPGASASASVVATRDTNQSVLDRCFQ